MDTRIVRLIAVAGAVFALPMMAQAGSDEADQLRARLAEMESENAALREAVGDRNLNDRQHEELQRLTAEAAGDPATVNASFLQGGSAGYDGGFFIQSEDGSFKLKHNAQLQVRYAFSYIDADDIDDFRGGFEMRRTKLKLKGHAFDDWGFGFTGAFSRSSGDMGLEDAYVKREIGEGMELKFGQFKGPFMREELTSSSRQLLVERSLVNEAFNQGFMQGVQLGYETDQWRFMAMFSDGFASANTSALTEDVDYAFTGRAEFLMDQGDWGRFKDFTSPMDDEGFAALFGVAAHYQHDERGTGDGSGGPGDDESDFFAITADASLEFGGSNLFASFVWADVDNNISDDFSPWGFTVQGGIYLNEDVEVFGRYEYGDSDMSSSEDLNILTAGVNYYMQGHKAKWTTDIGFAMDEVQSFWSSSGAAWRTDPAGEDGQIVFRTQFQFLY
jgi:hypothetical protein